MPEAKPAPKITPALTSGDRKDSAKDPAASPGEAFESLLILASRLVGAIDKSEALAKHELTFPAYLLLLSTSMESGGPLTRLGNGIGLAWGVTKRAASLLETKGFGAVRSVSAENGREQPFFDITDEGKVVLTEIRKELSASADQLPAVNWRAVPRLAAIVRGTRKAVPAKPRGAAAAA